MLDKKNVRAGSDLGIEVLEWDLGTVAAGTQVRERYFECDAIEVIDAAVEATGVGGGTYQYFVKTDTAASTVEANSGTARITSSSGLSALRHKTDAAGGTKVVSGAGSGTLLAGLAVKGIITVTGGTGVTRCKLRARVRVLKGREA